MKRVEKRKERIRRMEKVQEKHPISTITIKLRAIALKETT